MRADKSGAAYALILGDTETERRVVGLKSLRIEQPQAEVSWDNLAAELKGRDLLARLADARDSARPLPIFTVAIGADADRGALQAISGGTGGASYTVDTPSDIRDIFIDAVIEARK